MGDVSLPCEESPDYFFSVNAAEQRRAAEICRDHCPALEACRKLADDGDETFGVWGGETERARAKRRRREAAQNG